MASIAKNIGQLSVNAEPTPSAQHPQAQHQVQQCWPPKVTGAPWNRRNLYLPLSLPKAMTEPLKVMAPMAAPRNSSKLVAEGDQAALGRDAEGPGLGHRGHRDEDRRQADHAVHEGHQLGHLGHLDALGHQRADAAADEQANEHPDHAFGARLAHLRGEFDDQRGGGQDGDRHADHAEEVAADRGRGVAQALQGLDEADAGHQVQQRDEIHAHLSALPSSRPGPSCPSS